MMRYIDLGTVTPEYSVCADRALLSFDRTSDILMVYSRDRPSISLGRSGSLDDVRDRNITIVRRVSGGGTIYSDPGQLTYSVVFGKDRFPGSREDVFRIICTGLIDMFNSFGIVTTYKPVNDILAYGKKISGSAQYRSGDTVLQHGTILISVDTDDVERYLVSKGKSTLTSMENILGTVPERSAVVDSLKTAFRKIFGEIVDDTLDEYELEIINNLMKKESWK